MQGKKQQTPDQKKLGKKVGCGICGCAFTIPAFIIFMIYITTFSNYCAKMFGEETYPIAGDPSRFDPFAGIAEIRSKLGPKAILLDVRVSGVRSDGTLDLNAKYKPSPNADYDFRAPAKEVPEEMPPIGAGREPGDIWIQNVSVRVYEPGLRRSVTKTSGNSRTSYTYTNEGMDVDRGTPQMDSLDEGIPDPKMSIKEMWDFALSKGADKEAVAQITYNDDGYDFMITGLKFYIYWDKDGKLMQSRSQWPGKD